MDNNTYTVGPWTNAQKIGFRISFIFLLAIIIPFDVTWFQKLFSVKSTFDFFHVLSGYMPRYINISSESGKWGVASYSTLATALIFAFIIGGLWTALAKRKGRSEYNELYYWLKVIVRYRVALGIIAFGYIKLFPVQMPYPSLASLNTDFGNFSGYKLYWHAIGLVPWYQVFLGFVEVSAGVLLLFRPTLALGALINFGVLYNIAHANHAYDGGVHLYSAYLSILSLFLLLEYIPGVYKLLVKRQDVQPYNYVPSYRSKYLNLLLRTTKYIVAFAFIIFYGYLRYELHYVKLETKEPVTVAIKGIKGYYNVAEFRKNNELIQPSPTDSIQWQNVIFEKYSTMIYQVNKPIQVPQSNGSRQEKDIDRNYELTGIAGGRKFMYYEADTIKKTLHLYDKSLSVVRNRELERAKKNNKPRIPQMILHYEQPDPNTILLEGRNEANDLLRIVLKKEDRKYAVQIVRKN